MVKKSARFQVLRWLLNLRRKLKIRPKLVIGFSLLIALMMVGYGLGISASARAVQEINRTTNVRAPTALAASQAQANLLELVADLQAFLALGEAQYKESYANNQAQFEDDLANLEAINEWSDGQNTSDYQALAASLIKLRSLYDLWTELVPQLFALREDQLRREPALKMLIVDATPKINTVIVNASSIIATQESREATPKNLELLGIMADFQSSYYAMVAGLRGYVTTGRDSFKFEYSTNLDANQQAWEILANARHLLAESQLSSLAEIETAREAFLKLPEQMFNALENEHAREDLYLFRTEAAPLASAMIGILEENTQRQQTYLQTELDTGRQQLFQAQVISITGGLVVLLAGLLLAWLISRDIAQPIVELTATAQRIQAGDLAAQAEVDSEDEIEILGNTFNQMTAELRSTLESLWDYLEQVKLVMTAAAEVEESEFEPASLDELAAREDALGQLARVFQRMAREIRLREERLKQQVAELRIALDETRQQKKVAEITESQYFKDLQNEAEALRKIISDEKD